MKEGSSVIVHLASGIGNIVLATPLLALLRRNGLTVDLMLDADYPGVDALFVGWDAIRSVYSGINSIVLKEYQYVMAAIPPFYWRRFRARYTGLQIYRPPDALFYENERAYYLEFARELGCDVSCAPFYFVPRPPLARTKTIVLAPGSKPGEMARKRWPFFSALAEAFEDVALVGTSDDIGKGAPTEAVKFPGHVQSFIGRLSLSDTARVLAGASAVVANDCGLGHLAGALGLPTLLLFGPTPSTTLGPLPSTVSILRTGLACEPCWFRERFRACSNRVDCLQQLSVESVIAAVKALIDKTTDQT